MSTDVAERINERATDLAWSLVGNRLDEHSDQNAALDVALHLLSAYDVSVGDERAEPLLVLKRLLEKLSSMVTTFSDPRVRPMLWAESQFHAPPTTDDEDEIEDMPGYVRRQVERRLDAMIRAVEAAREDGVLSEDAAMAMGRKLAMALVTGGSDA